MILEGMMRVLFTALAASLVLAGCSQVSQSRVNPLNWFGRQDSDVSSDRADQTINESRDDVLISQIISLDVAPHPGGVLITAKAIAATEGFYDTALILRGQEDRRLIYEFRAKAPPSVNPPVGTPVTRELITGRFISTQDLNNAEQITVIAQQNQRSVTRAEN